ncbi:MAG: endonuclease [Desulfobulbus propionicus]|nr:MAG: endonuclease [Desulfobulbus propionicus]
MRFLLYNIRYATGQGTTFHLPFPYAGYLKRSGSQLKKIAHFIEDLGPDIIGLVEVDGGSFRTDRCCQAQYIANHLHLDHVIRTKYGLESVVHHMPLLKAQGNAILSRMPIISHRFHYFEEGVKRLVIQACTERVTVFLVHLSLTYRKRQNQLERLYRLVREVDRPLILAGDFNILGGKRELELFLGATGLVSANMERQPTFPSRCPRRELDFILHSTQIRARAFTIPGVTYSDHAPLLFDFDFT